MTVKYDFQSVKEWPSGIGTNLYLLGTSVAGPYMEPIYIKNMEHAMKIFGSPEKGTLLKAFEQAYTRNKNISIYLMRISGKSATLGIEGILPERLDASGNPPCLLRLRTIDAGEKYNTYSIELETVNETTVLEDGLVDEMILEQYLVLNTESGRFYYDILNLQTALELTKYINDDCRQGFHNVMASTDYPNESTYGIATHFAVSKQFDEIDEFFFSEGDDGLDDTRNDLYIACDLAYTLLSGRAIDTIVPVGLYVDDVHPAYLYGEGAYGSSFYSATRDYLQLTDTMNNNKVVSYHEQLIDFCREQTHLGYMTHGVIGMRPLAQVPDDIEYDDSYIQQIVEASAFKDRKGFLESTYGTLIDKGFYISVVAHDLTFTPSFGLDYHDSGAVLYGAMLTGHYDTTTRLPIGEKARLRYELSDKARYQLSRIGIVTFRDSVRYGQVVHSGVSAAVEQNDYHNIANVRMTQLTMAYMNDAIQAIYSDNYAPEVRRMMLEEEVRLRIELLTREKVILACNYQIRFNEDESKGEIVLTLMTKYSVEGIEITASIQYPEGA